MNGIRFRTRARTIDHLGQGQIADCPTAISELWKNAYDAYARDVALHIFDSSPPMAAIVDNGHGMSRDEFIDRWLVVGTESKASSRPTPEEDRFGLPPRAPQGAKGIGRLSVAYLGPLVLVISKRRKHDFVTSLIDWRVFENTYILLEDIMVPVETFADKDEFFVAFERMRTLLSENVWPTAGDPERRARLTKAWERHDEDRVKVGRTKLSDDIASSLLEFDVLTDERLRSWPVWSRASPCGTALFVPKIRRELSVWVDPAAPADDDEVVATKELLEDTLVAFVDPYSADVRANFRYEVVVHAAGTEKRPVTWERMIPIEELRNLEYVVEGEVDGAGVFAGRIRAFGEDKGSVALPPPRRPAPPSSAAYVGPYKVLLATFEQSQSKSSLLPEEFAKWWSRTERFGGFAVYRDDLRVMPYGRVQGDLFEIDARRGRHQGRHFWAYRRTIGRIAITHDGNPNLVDKAGREGLQDNHARREFKLRVIDLLETTARRYFGSDAPERDEKIKQNEERHRAALKEAGKRSRRQLRAELKSKAPQLEESLKQVEQVFQEMRQAIETRPAAIRTYEDAVASLRRRKSDLAVGAPPRNLDGDDEDRYRAYRDQYRKYREKADALFDLWTDAISKVEDIDPVALANRKHDECRNELAQAVHSWRREIHQKLDGEKARIGEWDRLDAARFAEVTAAQLVDLAHNRTDLGAVLSRFEAERETLRQEFAAKYGAYLRALERLIEGVDVEGALRWSSDEIDILKERIGQVHALAQLGVTVEIIGHEFETLDAEVRRGLSRLPRDAQATDAFRIAKNAHLSLTQKLRFLTPLKLSGPRLRDKIRGKEIAKYMHEFFGDRLRSARAELAATEAFNRIIVTELRSRLYPVFINLINNALYWITFAQAERRIALDCVGDAVIIGDSGKGVDPDDKPHLFELFFTRRIDGRGVGLYLCRENLGAGGHTIEYAEASEHRVLPGANFVIHFRGIEHG